MRWNDSTRKRTAVNDAEKQGIVADSIDVRMELIKRMENGEITLDQLKIELNRIKRTAKQNGKVTRQQAFSRG